RKELDIDGRGEKRRNVRGSDTLRQLVLCGKITGDCLQVQLASFTLTVGSRPVDLDDCVLDKSLTISHGLFLLSTQVDPHGASTGSLGLEYGTGAGVGCWGCSQHAKRPKAGCGRGRRVERGASGKCSSERESEDTIEANGCL